MKKLLFFIIALFGLTSCIAQTLEYPNIVAKNSLGVGIAKPSALAHFMGLTQQLRLGYNASNYATFTVGSTGSLTLDLIGTSPEFTFSKAVNVPVVAYDATTWNGNPNAAAMDAIRDKFESLSFPSLYTGSGTIPDGTTTYLTNVAFSTPWNVAFADGTYAFNFFDSFGTKAVTFGDVSDPSVQTNFVSDSYFLGTFNDKDGDLPDVGDILTGADGGKVDWVAPSVIGLSDVIAADNELASNETIDYTGTTFGIRDDDAFYRMLFSNTGEVVQILTKDGDGHFLANNDGLEMGHDDVGFINIDDTDGSATFTDNRAEKTGFTYKGFGEDSGGVGGDYSDLLPNAFVPKALVDGKFVETENFERQSIVSDTFQVGTLTTHGIDTLAWDNMLFVDAGAEIGVEWAGYYAVNITTIGGIDNEFCTLWDVVPKSGDLDGYVQGTHRVGTMEFTSDVSVGDGVVAGIYKILYIYDEGPMADDNDIYAVIEIPFDTEFTTGVSEEMIVTSQIDYPSRLEVNGGVEVENSVLVKDNMVVGEDGVMDSGNLTAHNDLSVGGDATISGGLTVTGNAEVAGLTVTGNAFDLDGITEEVAPTNFLSYNPTTKRVTYSDSPTGGGGGDNRLTGRDTVFVMFDDLCNNSGSGASTTLGDHGKTSVVVSGGGVSNHRATFVTDTMEYRHPGVLELNSGTTSNSTGYSLAGWYNRWYQIDASTGRGGDFNAEWMVYTNQTMGTSASIGYFIGFGSNSSTAATDDIIAFHYDGDVSDNWNIIADSSGTETSVDLGGSYVATADTWFKLGISWTLATRTLDFKINGEIVHSLIDENIPNMFRQPLAKVHKNTTTSTAQRLFVDYFYIDQKIERRL